VSIGSSFQAGKEEPAGLSGFARRLFKCLSEVYHAYWDHVWLKKHLLSGIRAGKSTNISPAEGDHSSKTFDGACNGCDFSRWNSGDAFDNTVIRGAIEHMPDASPAQAFYAHVAMKLMLEEMIVAMRVLTAINDKRHPNPEDVAELRRLAPLSAERPADELACDAIMEAIKRRVALRAQDGYGQAL
jgi:hypothetical protein